MRRNVEMDLALDINNSNIYLNEILEHCVFDFKILEMIFICREPPFL